MNYLKIDDNKGLYRTNSNDEYKTIDLINKDDILKLIKAFMYEDGFEMDEYEDELIGNKAHNIIYKNIYSKFQELEKEKDSILDSSNQYYEELKNKYSIIEKEESSPEP